MVGELAAGAKPQPVGGRYDIGMALGAKRTARRGEVCGEKKRESKRCCARTFCVGAAGRAERTMGRQSKRPAAKREGAVWSAGRRDRRTD